MIVELVKQSIQGIAKLVNNANCCTCAKEKGDQGDQITESLWYNASCTNNFLVFLMSRLLFVCVRVCVCPEKSIPS